MKNENKHHEGFKDFRFRVGPHILPNFKNVFINNEFEKYNLISNKYFLIVHSRNRWLQKKKVN